MAKASRFSKAEITKAALIAKDLGVTILLNVDGSIEISPASKSSLSKAEELEAELDRELDAFKLKHGYS